jgi:PhnB protein
MRLRRNGCSVLAAELRRYAPEQGGHAVKSISLAPMLSVRRGTEAVSFYKIAFGARELFKIEDGHGSVVAQLAVQSANFWVADESPANENFSPETLGGATARLVLVVEDPKTVHAQALAAGAKQVWPVREENGWLMGRVMDPFGHHWEIGKPLGPGVGE